MSAANELSMSVAVTHVQALRSGGAYVQATPIDAPLVEDRDELPARLIEALAPVMGQR
ncbi:MAG: hypothetical protein KF773_34640 [Deltaproteobacteria bacterium]|nr:hypothetical protein [Deltaproteobacteria bacterium]